MLKKHSSQPFGRYGKPKSLVMGNKSNLSHGKSRHRGQPMQALQATHTPVELKSRDRRANAFARIEV
ncbi:uncharacterized protein TrAtP1_000595 [Trichoderma atroviride]|uniref:uncharacterized protein n=1 Tax=Hypocrea atroviridis TaxID=63577 RepID=UPI003322E4BA|nr:hypothetical protein TrAtP1_000595 [Trichoderma atroviride]